MFRRLLELFYDCLFWLGVLAFTAFVFVAVVAYARFIIRWIY